MKTKIHILMAIATAAGTALASAQNEQRPNPATPPSNTPPPAADGQRPPPDGQRPPPNVQRPPPDGQRPPPDAQRPPPGGPRPGPDGQRPPDGQPGPEGRPPGARRPFPGDGERGLERGPSSQGDHPGDRARHPQHPPLAPPKPVAYIGVATGPVPPALAAQLSLPEGFGLVVENVMPDSPAAAAGIQRYDVLKLYNDQQVVNQPQLAVLIRAAGKDAQATLTLFRKGHEQKVSIKQGEHVLNPHPMREPGEIHPAGDRGMLGHPDFDHRLGHRPGPGSEGAFQGPGAPGGPRGMEPRGGAPGAGREGAEHHLTPGGPPPADGPQPPAFDRAGRPPQDRGQGFSDRVRDFQKRIEQWRGHQSPGSAQPPELPPAGPGNLIREIRPGGAAQIRVMQPDGTVVYNTANAKVLLKDDSGEIEIAAKDGHRSLVAKDGKGETLFNGPIETPEQVDNLPDDIRKKVDWIDARTQMELADAGAPPPRFDGEFSEPDLTDSEVTEPEVL